MEGYGAWWAILPEWMTEKAPAARSITLDSWALRPIRPGDVGVVVGGTDGRLRFVRCAQAAAAIGVAARVAFFDVVTCDASTLVASTKTREERAR